MQIPLLYSVYVFDVDYFLRTTEYFHIFGNIRQLFNISVLTAALIYELAAML